MPHKLYSCSQLDLHPCLRVSLFFVSERQHIDLYWVFSRICSKHIFWGMCGWPCVHCRLPMSDMSIGVHSLGQWVPQMRSRQLQSMCCRHTKQLDPLLRVSRWVLLGERSMLTVSPGLFQMFLCKQLFILSEWLCDCFCHCTTAWRLCPMRVPLCNLSGNTEQLSYMHRPKIRHSSKARMDMRHNTKHWILCQLQKLVD